MAKHQLIISRDSKNPSVVRSEEGQLKHTRTLVVNWKGSWEPREQPGLFLVVAPGDELEIVFADEQHESASLWFFSRVNPLSSLLLPLPESHRQGQWERVDLQKGSVILTVNGAIARDSGESRYDLRVSAVGEMPPRIVGQGNPGTMTASKP
ncbi:hypothetical protein ATI61_108240 [Archangium gephyra]|uniref:Uncharacterized protein n=1 Tax=Archangium gephyra TaxID=48 RepID=A0AAC8Q7D4_9BACT|nr:hypothetical protein [Archangium gephyra]AKJ02373.1 Hypothetical protein AA314_03999 [Archangium gephyra]REG28699.1 hypothetical protein ATI61_108240 [Archangium gephyra]